MPIARYKRRNVWCHVVLFLLFFSFFVSKLLFSLLEKEREVVEKIKEDALNSAKERENVLQEELAKSRIEAIKKGKKY